MKVYRIELTPKSILLVVLTVIGLFVAWQLRLVIFMFFIAFIIASALRPLVEFLHKMGIPRIISILIIYTTFIAFIGLVLYLSGVVVFEQVQRLFDNSTTIITDVLIKLFETFPWLKDVFDIKDTSTIYSQVQEFLDANLGQFLEGSIFTTATGETVINTITNISGFLFGVFTILVLSAYMLQREDKFYAGFLQTMDKERRDKTQSIIDKVEAKLGNWLLAQFVLMLAVGLTTYLGLLIPGIFFPDNVFTQYAIPLALIAGILEAVPNLGPVVTWVIAVLVTLGSGGNIVEITYIAILFTAIQQLEAVLLVPYVMKKAIGIDPVIVILGLLAASSLFGIIGAILVLPLIATIQIILEESFKVKQPLPA